MRKTTVNSTQGCAKKEMRYQVCPLAQVTARIMVLLNVHLTKTMKTPPCPGHGVLGGGEEAPQGCQMPQVPETRGSLDF